MSKVTQPVPSQPSSASDSNSIILRGKQKILNVRIQEYEAATDQLAATQDKATQVILNEKIAQLESEIAQLADDIQSLESEISLQKGEETLTADVRRTYDNNWQNTIHRLDFKPARKATKKIFERMEDSGEAALFFLHKSTSMGGQWCTQLLREELHRLDLRFARPCQYAFESHQVAEPEPFLNFLASQYTVSSRAEDETLLNYIARIQKKIWSALRDGNLFLIELHISCDISGDTRFLSWFVKEFWQPLCLPLKPQQRIRLVGIVSVDSEVPKTCLPETLCCTSSKFDKRKLLSLPLRKWKEEEIRSWLIDRSGLADPPISRSSAELERMATSIFKNSKKGEPMLVYTQLMDKMSRRVG